MCVQLLFSFQPPFQYHAMEYGFEDSAKPLYMRPNVFDCGFKFDIAKLFGSLVHLTRTHNTIFI